MAKVKTTFFCQSCGSQYAKWLGQCPACKEWNTIVEEVITKIRKKRLENSFVFSFKTRVKTFKNK